LVLSWVSLLLFVSSSDDFEDEIQQENDFLNQGNKEAPDWPDVVNILLSEIHIAQELYEKKEKNKGLKLTFNFPNFSALLGKVSKHELE
jgi:hypothetical protein